MKINAFKLKLKKKVDNIHTYLFMKLKELILAFLLIELYNYVEKTNKQNL